MRELTRPKDVVKKGVTDRLHCPDTGFHLYKHNGLVKVGILGKEPMLVFDSDGDELAIQIIYKGLKKLMEESDHDVFNHLSKITFAIPWQYDKESTEKMNQVISAFTETRIEVVSKMALQNPSILALIRRLNLSI